MLLVQGTEMVQKLLDDSNMRPSIELPPLREDTPNRRSEGRKIMSI